MAGPAASLTLRVSAPQAIQEFKEMAAAARALRTELAGLQGQQASGGAVTALRGQVNELTASLRTAQATIETLQQQMATSSVEALRQVKAEERAIREKEATARREARETAATKKAVDREVSDSAKARAAIDQKRDYELYASQAVQGNFRGLTQQRRDYENYIASHREELAARAAGVLQSRALADEEARVRAYGAMQARAIAENEAMDARARQNYIKVLNDNDARIRREGVIQYRALNDNELATRRMGVLQAKAQADAEKLQRAEELAERRLAAMQIAAQIEDARRTELAAREKALLERKAMTAAEAEQAAASRANVGTARSAARGAAAAGGGLFLTYGQNIPALAATFAAGTAIKESIQQGSAFEKTMAFVQIAAEDSKSSIADLSGEVLKMASSGSLFGPQQLAEGLRKLVEAGLSTKDAMTSLTPVMNLATLAQIDVGQAAKVAQGLMHAFGLEAKDMGRIGDVMAKAANISATDVSQMGEALKQSSTVARQFNVTIEEQAGLLAVLAKSNITGSAAGTALRNMFTELDPHTTKARLAFKQLKIDVYDASGRMRGMVEILQELSSKLATMDQKSVNRFLQDAFNERGTKAAFAGIQDAFRDLPSFIEQLKHASEGIGYMAESAKILGDTASGAWDKFKAAFSASLISSFNSSDFVPLMERLTAAVADPHFIRGISSLVSGFSTLVGWLIDGVRPLGAVVEGWQGLSDVFKATQERITQLMTGTDNAVAGSSAVAAAGGAARLSTQGGIFGYLLFGGWMGNTFQERIDTIRMGMTNFLEFIDPWKNSAQQILEIDARVAKLNSDINTNTEKGQRSPIAEAERNKLLADRLRLLQQINVQRASVRPAVPKVDPYEVDSSYKLSDRVRDMTAPPRPGSGNKPGYDRLIAEEEAAKRARFDQQLAREKIAMAAREAGFKREQQLLDIKHRYGLITEEDYTERVDALQDQRIAVESEANAKAMMMLQGRIASLKIESVRIAERTKLIELEAKARQLVADAEGIKEQRGARVDGEREKRDRDNRAAAAAYREELNKISEALELQRDKARQQVEGVLQDPATRVANEAILGVRSAYASEEAKLRREIAQLEEKGTDAAKERLEYLRPQLDLLREQREMQEGIAASEAQSNRARQREFTYGWRESFLKYQEDATNSAQNARDIFTASTRAMEDAIVKFSTTGKFSFRDFANTIIQEMLRIAARRSALGLMNMLGSLLPGAGGGAGGAATGGSGGFSVPLLPPTPLLISAHTGGIIGAGGLGSRYVSPMALYNAPKFHGGGIVGDERPIIARRGEGVFTPAQMSAMGGDNIQISITVNTDGTVESSGSPGAAEAALARRIADVSRGVIQQEQRPGGLLARVR